MLSGISSCSSLRVHPPERLHYTTHTRPAPTPRRVCTPPPHTQLLDLPRKGSCYPGKSALPCAHMCKGPNLYHLPFPIQRSASFPPPPPPPKKSALSPPCTNLISVRANMSFHSTNHAIFRNGDVKTKQLATEVYDALNQSQEQISRRPSNTSK